MPYELIWEDWGVVFRYWGVASDHDLQQANLEFYDHPRFAEIDYTLVDYTDVTKLDYSIDDCNGAGTKPGWQRVSKCNCDADSDGDGSGDDVLRAAIVDEGVGHFGMTFVEVYRKGDLEACETDPAYAGVCDAINEALLL